jgi:anaerobic selenocysteine-containing dehydrogenase
LWTRLGPPRRLGRAARWIERLVAKLGPETILELALRLGPHDLSLARLKAAPHGIDLGPLERRLPQRLRTPDRRIDLAPAAYLADLARLDRLAPADGLVLIGRRHLRSNNSWMHNSARLAKGPERCTLMIHPEGAARRSIADGDLAKVSVRDHAIVVPAEVTDAVMPGVVSIPHGWGHGRAGIAMRIAAERPGQSVNDILDPAVSDELSGTSALSGQRVEVTRAS